MIPPIQARAAAIAGKLAAEGKITMLDILPDLVAAAAQQAPRLDRSGLRMRLAHAMTDSAAAHAAARARAMRAVRRATEDALALRRPRRAVLAAAAAADPRAILAPIEREEIVLAALARVMGNHVSRMGR